MRLRRKILESPTSVSFSILSQFQTICLSEYKFFYLHAPLNHQLSFISFSLQHTHMCVCVCVRACARALVFIVVVALLKEKGILVVSIALEINFNWMLFILLTC